MKKLLTVAVVLLVLSNVFVFASVSANEYKKAFEQKQNLRSLEEQKEYAAVMNERLNRSGVPVAFSTGVAGVQSGFFINPINGVITSHTGTRDIGDGAEHHKGLDIAAPTGTPIKASAGGIVTYSGLMGTYGNVIIIDHADRDMMTVYAHQSRLLTVAGQSVQQSQIIGLVGSTGRSTGPHLHFEIHQGDWNSGRTNYVDPLKYISL